MTLASVQQFSTTASSNTDIDGISVATGWPPANVGPAFRELMALLASALQPLQLSIGGQSAVTLAAAQASAQFIAFSGTLAGTCTVTLPNAPFLGMVRNATGGSQSVVLTAGSGTTVTLPADAVIRTYYCDGAGNVVLLAVGNTSIGGTFVSGTGGNTIVSFNPPFPNQCLGFSATPLGGQPNTILFFLSTIGVGGISGVATVNGAFTAGLSFSWIAVGN